MRVMTFNIAHGRATSFHQALVPAARIRENLAAIAATLDADVVALQEADGPSLWSGRFDHVDALASQGGFADRHRGSHMRLLGLDYGTALLSRRPLNEKRAVTFAPSFPTPSKGFVVAAVDLEGAPVDVVSLHLDFARASVRARQLGELKAALAERARPAIVMGDFNCEYDGIERLGLTAYRPDARDLATYPAFRKRLDWILISRGLGFCDYRTIPGPLSDHSAVVAEVRRT